MKQILWIETSAGISADRFAAALIGLGVPERGMIHAIKAAGEKLGMLDTHIHLEFLPDETLARRLHIIPLEKREPLPLDAAPAALETALSLVGVQGAYADFARQVLSGLRAAADFCGGPVSHPVRRIGSPMKLPRNDSAIT